MKEGPKPTFFPRTGDTSSSNNVPSRQVSQCVVRLLVPKHLGSTRREITLTPTLEAPIRPQALIVEAWVQIKDLTRMRSIPDESRLSNVSLQDNQDYSRQLRVGLTLVFRQEMVLTI